MFLVRQSITERHSYIECFLDCDDASVAVLLAAADFERCIRRAILALGQSPTKNIREGLFSQHFHGLEAFKEGWKKEVKPRLGVNLANDVVRDWGRFKKAFGFRHQLIHGATNKLSVEFASGVARTVLRGASDLDDFARDQGASLDGVIRRYKRR